jgi:hypothetical protein
MGIAHEVDGWFRVHRVTPSLVVPLCASMRLAVIFEAPTAI